jgi:prepilin-type N-terminal cleavage/methylation domain-containing protein
MWITNRRKKQNRKNRNNRGMTLAELLVALAVSSIVLAGLSAILFSVLRMYGRTNANVEAQNETQTALNLVLDSILSTKGVCLAEWDADAVDDSALACALFGELNLVTADKTMNFSGDAVFWQPGLKEMYLMSGTYDLGTYSDEAQAPLEAIAQMKTKLPEEQKDRLPYLMAQNVTAFEIKTDAACFDTAGAEASPSPEPSASPGKIKYYYNAPLILNVSMTVEVDYQNGKSVTRELSDSVSVRNRLNYVYIQRDSKGMVKYLRNQG